MEYAVIGAGPAGLQLAYYLQQAGRDYVVLEAGPTPGTFFRTFPRHRRMISINKPHTGWHDAEKDLVDWNSCCPTIPRSASPATPAATSRTPTTTMRIPQPTTRTA